jgi:hypothetical protein
MRNVFVVVLMMVFVVTSCEKKAENLDDNTNNNQALTSEYLPLSVGNYWVYQYFRIDENGVETEMEQQDSIRIVKDTTINGNTFYIKEGNNILGGDWVRLEIVRDSAAHLIDETGKILFSESNFTDTISFEVEVANSDTLYTQSNKMETVGGNVVYPAGTFANVLDNKGTVMVFLNIPENIENPRIRDKYFAPSIGEISNTYFYISSPSIMLRKLISYHIE